MTTANLAGETGRREGGMKGKVDGEQGETWRGSKEIKSLGYNVFHCTFYIISPGNRPPLTCIKLNITWLMSTPLCLQLFEVVP